jgi:hypothetical protein
VGGTALIVTELELTAVGLVVDATLNEKFDVGSVTVRPILTVSQPAILQVLSRMITRPLVVVAEPPLVPFWTQLAAFPSTSETLVAPDTGTLPALSVTVMVSALGMALGAVVVIR